MLDTTNLRNRLQASPWLRGLQLAPDGTLLLVMNSAFPGGQFISAAVTAAPVLEAMAREGDRALYIVDRAGTLRLSTNAAKWPQVAAALGRRMHEAATIIEGAQTFTAVSTPLTDLAGSEVGTLVAVSDVTGAAQRQQLVVLLTGSLAVLVFATLLFTLYGMVKGCARPAWRDDVRHPRFGGRRCKR